MCSSALARSDDFDERLTALKRLQQARQHPLKNASSHGQDRVITLARGIFKGGCDVFRFEQGIVRNDLVARSAGRQQVKHILDANTQSPDAGAPTAMVGIHGHAVQLAHGTSPWRR
jgi:hypothetical protein